jgi:hypothetical protein
MKSDDKRAITLNASFDFVRGKINNLESHVCTNTRRIAKGDWVGVYVIVDKHPREYFSSL